MIYLTTGPKQLKRYFIKNNKLLFLPLVVIGIVLKDSECNEQI